MGEASGPSPALTRFARVLSVGGGILIGLGLLVVLDGAYETIGGVIPTVRFAVGAALVVLGILMRLVAA